MGSLKPEILARLHISALLTLLSFALDARRE
jgi:hypothetical protein